MNKAFQDPELVRGFERLVEEFNHKKWSQVAKQLQVQYNVKVTNPSVLKPMWEKLNLNKEMFTPIDEKLLLELFVKHRSVISHMTEEFNALTNKRYTKQRLYCQSVLLVRRSLANLAVLFSQKKQHNKQIMSHFSPKSVGKFLSVCDLTNLKEPFNKMIQESAHELIDLLKAYKNCMNDIRQRQYSKLKNVMCRWKFEKILYCMYYIDQIKQIFDKKYTEDQHLYMKDANNQLILKHELLLPTLEDNRECEIYERIFFEDNSHKFLDLYNVSKHENNHEYLYYIEPPKKKIQEGKIKEVHKKHKMTIRGRIRTDSEPLHRGWKTTIFQYQEEETNQDLTKNKAKNDKS